MGNRFQTTIFISLTALLFFSWLTGGARSVSAHATSVRSEPIDGITLSKSPQQLKVWFDEGVVTDFSKFELADNAGKAIPVLNLHREMDKNGQVILVGNLPELLPNAYRVNWQTRSEDDLHIIKGSYIFGVQQAVSLQPSTAQNPANQPVEVILRWLIFTGLGVLAGALALSRRLPAGVRQVQQRLAGLGFLGCSGTIVVQLGMLAYLGLPDGSMFQILSNTAYGERWWLSQLLLLVMAALIFRLISRPSTSKSFTLPGLLLLPVVALQAMNGHIAPGRGFLFFFNVTLDGLHLLAASFWTGGVFTLLIAVMPLLRPFSPEKSMVRPILQNFGKLAGLCLLVLIVTGFYKSSQQIASLDGLLTTLYGQALLVKIELVLLVALLGLLNTAILHPRVGDKLARILHRPVGWRPIPAHLLKRLMLAETTGLALTLLVAAFLTSSQPARGPEFNPPLAENPPVISQPVNDLLLSFSVKPNRPGQNFLTFSVLNTRRPAPAPIEKVNVRLHSLEVETTDLQLKAEPIGGERYQITGNQLKYAGNWQITLEVERPGLPLTELTIPWRVSDAIANNLRPVVISNQPLAPWFNTIAVFVLVAGMASWFGFRQNSRSNLQQGT